MALDANLYYLKADMTKKDWFGIGYVSAWVVVWGTVGSLIDLPLLNSQVYVAGSLGQITTFAISALLSVLIGVWIYPKILTNKILINALGLDTDQID